MQMKAVVLKDRGNIARKKECVPSRIFKFGLFALISCLSAVFSFASTAYAVSVSSVTSSTPDGSYRSGQVINVQVIFSGTVFVNTAGGTPTLTLETGASDAVVNYSSGSGTTTLVFSYTIQAGHTSSDLNYAAPTALTVNGGTIRDGVGVDASLTLPGLGGANSLAGSKALVIDTSSPTVSITTSASSVTNLSPFPVTITFNESVTGFVVGDITVSNGTLSSFSGSGASYSGQVSPSSNGVVTVDVAAGVASDAAGNTNTAATQLARTYDSIAPSVNSVSSTTSDGIYRVGQSVNVRVAMSEAVTVTGTPQITLETGSSDAVATYSGATGTPVTNLDFTFTVASGHTSSDLDYTATNSLVLNGGTILDAAGNAAVLTLPTPGGVNSLRANKALVIDGVVPTVTGISSSSPNGNYRLGDVISIQVSFSETVTVTGTPTLTLETGTSDAVVSYTSGSGSSVLTFTYTVAAGHNTSDLDCQSTAALAGTIQDSSGNTATLTVPVGATAGSLASNKAIIVDAVVPTVSSVDSSTSDGSYKAGQSISIQVNFSETVTVTGSPRLTLETGAVDAVVNYASGSGTSSLTFIYTVANGENSSDLDCQSASALSLNGGAIVDSVGNNATLTLPVGSGTTGALANNRALVVDTAGPTITSVSSSTANGAYRASQSISIQVNFSEAVVVSGTPQLTLETGAADAVVNFTSGSGTSSLTFTYTISAGHTSSDLDYISSSALSLNGGSITDIATNDAAITLFTPGAAGSLGATRNIVIDTTSPSTVLSTTSSSPTANYPIPIAVNFPESVTGLAISDFTVINGCAYNLTGSGSSYSLEINPTSTGIVSITLPAGSVTDAAGNPNTASSTVSVDFQTAAPRIVSVTSPTSNGSYRAGQTIVVQVNFSREVNVTGVPQLTLETGASDAVVNYSSGSGSSVLTFNYTIQSGHNSSDLDYRAYTSVSPFSLNGGTITDVLNSLTDAAILLACPGSAGSLGASAAIVVDTIPPAVSSLNSSTANGAYRAGQTLSLQVNFPEIVTVVGAPTLTLETGASDAVVNYASGSGTSALTFLYTIASGENSSDLDSQSANALALNGGSITDAAGNDATIASLTLPVGSGTANSLANNRDLVVDTIPPNVSNITATNANGSYKAGVVIGVQAGFSEPVLVAGSAGAPVSIALSTGGVSTVNYTSGSGTSTLLFNYTIAAGDTSSDLAYTSTTALTSGGRTIRDPAGNDAILTLAAPGAAGSLDSNKNIIVDTTAPTILSVSTSTADGTYRVGSPVIPIAVTFSENVNVTGAPRLQLGVGGSTFATYSSGSGSSVLVFNYTIAAGNNSPDLDYSSTTALGLNGGTIRDAATNDANLTLPSPGAAGSISFSKNIVIDTAAPTVLSVTSASADGYYTVGATIDLVVNFSEPVVVSGSPQITLETGTTDAVALYTGGSGGTALSFRYTVAAGENSSDLDVQGTSALSANGGTMRDSVGNDANLTLALPTFSSTRSIVVDTTVPTISSVSSTTADGVYKVGDPAVVITVAFSENVTVTGSPRIQLAVGGTRYATYSSGGGTSLLTFNYTIEAGDNAPFLDYSSTSALSLNGGTIRDVVSNNATLTLPTPGAVGSLSYSKAIKIDTTSPTITGVTATTADGFYKEGSTIELIVGFSEEITVTGVPRLTLETGSTDGVATYVSGSGTTSLTFRYVVGAGENSSDLDVRGASALETNGGTIRDWVGNDATLTLTLPTFSSTRAIVVDTTAPTVMSVSSTASNGAYTVGSPTIPITVTFSESVTVSGAPRLQLDVGGTTFASYASGSGSSALVFNYTVGAGDTSSDLDYSSTTALELNGGTIRDLAVNDPTLTLPSPGTSGSIAFSKSIVIDTSAPSVIITSTAPSVTNQPAIPVTITFSEAVTGFVAGDISRLNGTISNFVAVSGTTYTADLIPSAEGLVQISISAGVAVDVAGNSNLASTTFSITYDITQPTVVLSSSASASTNLSPIPISIVFSEGTSNFAIGDITVVNGTLGNFSGSGTTYSVDVTPTTNGVVQVSVGAGVATDAAGNGNQASAILSRTFDTVRPTVTLSKTVGSVTNQSPFTVNIVFNESVTGLALGDFSLVNGSVGNLSGSGTSYTVDVTPSIEGVVTISLPVDSANDNAGNGNQASNEISVIYDLGSPSVTVSSSAPSPTNLSPIPYTITFSENVTGFAIGDVTVINGSVTSMSGTGLTRAISVTPAGQGNVEVSVGAGVAADAAGNGNLASNLVIRVFDSIAPVAPIISAPTEGSLLTSNQPAFNGTGEVGATVSVREGVTVICTAVVAGDGSWNCTPSTAFAEGRHALVAVATDAAGNDSAPSATLNIVIDAVRLEAPTVDASVSQITSDVTPLVFGRGPVGMLVHVRKGSTTLCTTTVTSAGAWGCDLAQLPTGAQDLIAWAQDPADDTVSDDVPFSMLIGVAYRGVVTMANQDGTPLEGVSVSYETASTVTDSAGAFDLPVPDEPGVVPSLTKRGWSINLTSGSLTAQSGFSYSAVPALENKSYAIWDSPEVGFNHVLKLLNKGSSTQSLSVTLVASSGDTCTSLGSIAIPVLGDYQANLTASSCLALNTFGFMEVANSDGVYDGEFESFVPGGSDRDLKTSALTPLMNSLFGSSFVMYDTTGALINRRTDLQFVENALLISNVSDEDHVFDIRYRATDGAVVRSTSLSVPGRATVRAAIGSPGQKRAESGLVEIVPDSDQFEYVASMRRYGYKFKFNKKKKIFVKSKTFYVMNEPARSGISREHRARFEYVSKFDAQNFIELANTTSSSVTVTINHVGQELKKFPRKKGKRKQKPKPPKIIYKTTNLTVSLPRYGSSRVPFSRFIKSSTEGVVTISANRPDSILTNIVMNQYNSRRNLNASSNFPVLEVFGDDQYGVYDSNPASALWVSNVASESVAVSIECLVGGNTFNVVPLTIAERSSSVTQLGSCFRGASSGVVRVNSSLPGGILADRVRARSRRAFRGRVRID
jgi:hypothetical protein